MAEINFKDLRPYPPKYPPYPPYSDVSMYLEHYFYAFFKRNLGRFAPKPRTYLPIYWTTLYNDHVRVDINRYLAALPQDQKYFTVVQHDDGVVCTLPKDTLVFGTSPYGRGDRITIPLLTSPIPERYKTEPVEKSIFCSFVGTITHPIREKLFNRFKNNSKFQFNNMKSWSPVIDDSDFQSFVSTTRKSRFALAPRGYSPNSFRLYEIMQLNTIPVLVSDSFMTPYAEELNWSEFCVLIGERDIENLDRILSNIDESQYQKMLARMNEVYSTHFTLEAMSEYVLRKI